MVYINFFRPTLRSTTVLHIVNFVTQREPCFFTFLCKALLCRRQKQHFQLPQTQTSHLFFFFFLVFHVFSLRKSFYFKFLIQFVIFFFWKKNENVEFVFYQKYSKHYKTLYSSSFENFPSHKLVSSIKLAKTFSFECNQVSSDMVFYALKLWELNVDQ